MPNTITALPARPDQTVLDPVPADGQGWAHDAWAWISGPTASTLLTTITAAVLTGLAVYLLMRRPSNGDNKKHLMYVPLLLVNGAAVYGQVAFFYERVAPTTWATPGKIALAVVIALAVESIAVYVGWHAHDALLNKAGTTAAHLRRASYLIAALVAGINYAHFADFKNPDTTLGLNAASLAFGLLSLLSPWLWGLHTRRMQHVQLRKEGVVDATGATFSSERVRSFPLRAYMARRWSIDHYVTDPQAAWEGYNADLRVRWANTADSPTWWLRTNPVARVRQLTAAVDAWKVALTITLIHGAAQAARLELAEKAVAEFERKTIAQAGRIGQLTAERDALTGEVDDTRAVNEELTARLTEQVAETAAVRAEAERAGKAKDARIGELETKIADDAVRHTEELRTAARKAQAELTAKVAIARSEGRVTNLNDRRSRTNRITSPAPTGKAELTDESAVQMMLTAHPDPSHEWSKNAVRTLTGVGLGRAERLIGLWVTAATEKAGGKPEAVNQ
jgi:hypothetical protein